MDKQLLQERTNIILSLLKEFCTEKLNQEYYELSERLLRKLGRKRNVPFMTGKPEIWAAAILHALGTINFLFDKSSEPYITIDEIHEFYSTNKSTVGAKSKFIRDLLRMNVFNSEFSTHDVKANNPLQDFVMVDGFILPVNSLPEEYQAMVREARAHGREISFTRK